MLLISILMVVVGGIVSFQMLARAYGYLEGGGDIVSGWPTRVKRGQRLVHGDKELVEKLGRGDLCPCNSRRRFQELLPANWQV